MVSFIILYCNIILPDHRCICGPSLTETSLCGAWLCKFSLPWRPRISYDWTWHRLIYEWYWIQIFSLVSDLTVSGCSNCYQKWDWYVFIGWLLRALHVASHIFISPTVMEVNCILHCAVLWFYLFFIYYHFHDGNVCHVQIHSWVGEHMREISWLWWFIYFCYHCTMCVIYICIFQWAEFSSSPQWQY